MKDSADIVAEKTALYRHYDCEGKLLYVGISLSPASRTSQHSRSAHWFRDIYRIDVEWYDDREKALDAERIAIKSEQPTHNIWGALKTASPSECAGMTQLDTFLRGGSMTAKALADAVKVSQPYITDLRYQRRTPSDDVALRIEAATGGEVPADSFKRPEKGAA